MRAPDQPRVKIAICAEAGPLSDAIERALLRSGAFEVVGMSSSATELAGLVHTYLPKAVVIDEHMGGGDVAKTLSRVTTGRPIRALVLVDDEATEIRRKSTAGPNLDFLARPTLIKKGLAARSHVAHTLGDLAQACGGSPKDTIPTDLLVEAVERRQALAKTAGIRVELATLGSWPLDLIVLVGGRGNEGLFAELMQRVTELSVPVLVALRPYAALKPMAWGGANVSVTHLDEDVPLSRAEGFLVAPRTGAVRLSPNAIRVEHGHEPLLVVDLVRSTGALQSGALTVQLGDDETDAAIAMAGALDAGAVGAVLDPSATEHPAGPSAALSWGRGLVTLKPAEIAWLLGNAVPRRT
jgi:hypothetical protein